MIEWLLDADKTLPAMEVVRIKEAAKHRHWKSGCDCNNCVSVEKI